MTLVRFATTCDVAGPDGVCGARSAEGIEWRLCRGCLDHVCDAHVAPATLREESRSRRTGDVVEDYEVETVLCPTCVAQGVEE